MITSTNTKALNTLTYDLEMLEPINSWRVRDEKSLYMFNTTLSSDTIKFLDSFRKRDNSFQMNLFTRLVEACEMINSTDYIEIVGDSDPTGGIHYHTITKDKFFLCIDSSKTNTYKECPICTPNAYLKLTTYIFACSNCSLFAQRALQRDLIRALLEMMR